MIKGFKYTYLTESFLAAIIVGIIIPGIYLARAYYNNTPFMIQNAIEGVIFSFSVTFCLYFANSWIIEIIQKAEKKFKSQVSRLFFELLVTMVISVVLMYFFVKIFLFVRNVDPKETRIGMYDSIVIAIIVTLICVSITELFFFLNKWKKTLVETEQLKRQNIESQYAALTSQVNPHFLFNSLNALNSLIQNDPEKALIFNREFAKIYRYVLDSKDKLVVTLQEELDFLNSYLYLQKIRYDKALQYQIEINFSCMDYYLPPLSLQLLIENSIKHNEVSEEKPLHIKISCEGMELTIINNYQPIGSEKRSEGIGLKNLIERYSHYTDIMPVFKIENNEYIARIPLLKDE
jgi:two-component system, LytTR family, sensor kinase